MLKKDSDFRVGDNVVLTDGKVRVIRKIDGVRKGCLRVGSLLFDWTGNEVDTLYCHYRIEPIKD